MIHVYINECFDFYGKANDVRIMVGQIMNFVLKTMQYVCH